MCVYMCMYVYVYMHVYMCMCMHVCMCMYVYVCIILSIPIQPLERRQIATMPLTSIAVNPLYTYVIYAYVYVYDRRKDSM